ncbi:MAG: type I-A CRISPR-associated protein Cas5a [Nitrososphaerota archaeon]
MMLLHIRARFHWGYSVKHPFSSKGQPAFALPPPNTLKGALLKGLMDNSETIYTSMKRRKLNLTSSAFLMNFIKAASCRFEYEHNEVASEWLDINRYIVLHFQKPARRALMEYRFGAIPSGKVLAPHRAFHALYLIDEDKVKSILGDGWKQSLIRSAWSITRIGSKESIVSVEDVKLNDSWLVKQDVVKTSYYFPSEAKESIENHNYDEVEFWDDEFGAKKPKPVRYIIPGKVRGFIESDVIELRLSSKGLAYTDGENVMVISRDIT